MLATANRLSRAEFTTVFSRPQKRVHFPEYSLYYSPTPTFKASVVVGKKVAKLAVRRNRLRRVVYGALARYCATYVPLAGSYIIILKPAYGTLTEANQQAVIESLLAQMVKLR